MLAPLSSATPAFMSNNRVAVETLVAGITIVALAAWVIWWQRNRATLTNPDRFVDADPHRSAMVVPADTVLADVLDDLRRELTLKLHGLDEATELARPRRGSDNLLLGERAFEVVRMKDSVSARAAGAHELQSTPRRLLLLALESGKWRTGEECAELLKVQQEAIKAITAALRESFLTWVFQSEEQRLRDHSFVQEVLYAPPPGVAAEVSQFCFAPGAWDRPDWLVKIDRCCLEDSIHFMYLVQNT
jgi:hypothetical protein